VTAAGPKLSIVSQSLDRAAFVAYFLGAIVPLCALGAIVHVWVLPNLNDRLEIAGLVAGVVSIAVLSAAAFLLLRRVTRRAITAMRTDNERLEALVEGATQLTAHEHGREVAAATTAAALRVAHAAGAFFIATASGAPPKLEASAGDGALYESTRSRVGELFGRALEEGRALSWRNPSGAGALVPVIGAGALMVVLPPRRALDAPAMRALTMLAAQASIAMRRGELIDAQRNFFVHVTDILVAALDAHMDLQAGHARRVAQLANRLGRELGLDESRRQRLHFAALLHDVGMLRIDPARLDDKRVARQHPQLGHRMLAPIQLWSDVAPLVLHHHEWFDGSGYPEQLAGDAIPLESRIIGIAEAFDSMTSRSTYKEPVPNDEAVRRIEAGSGTQFDPAVVRAFLDLARRGDLDLG
jgi:HD-GYP domain-containing protein (c-di-GMP phosphodiesterase class II)